MALRFGTDGVRGLANAELTAELALALGRAAARVLGGDRVVVGRDTRRSGPLLEAALAAGFASSGTTVERLGVVPTPAVAFVAQREQVPGAVISASHNHYADNGIKLFAAGGRKLPDDVEEQIERELDAELAGSGAARPSGMGVGTVLDRPDEVDAYLAHLVAALEGRRLDGQRVMLDCANGAASHLAPHVFRLLGADVGVLHDRPDGCNINERCGAAHPEELAAAVVAQGYDLGLAFDGDADRCIAVDERGATVDGDHLIAISALDRQAERRLTADTVVVTVMTNLGFRLAMERAGITVVETAVGDRYVLEALEAGGYDLGGEQSGHVIFRDLATTGDGLLTGIALCDVVARRGGSLASLASQSMQRLPQVLVNVRVTGGATVASEAADSAVRAAEGELAGRGRVLVRASGTEPLVRVMVEAPTEHEARAVAERLAGAIRSAGPTG